MGNKLVIQISQFKNSMHKAEVDHNRIHRPEWEQHRSFGKRQRLQRNRSQDEQSHVQSFFKHPKHKHINHTGNTQATTVKITMIKPMRKNPKISPKQNATGYIC